MRALAAWKEADVKRAIHPSDRAAIDATESVRGLILDLAGKKSDAKTSRDLFNAGARLGRMLADLGASPSLAASTIEGAARALAQAGVVIEDDVVAPLRASVAEGYLAGVLDAERACSRRAWEWPACAVRLDRETAAIAAGYPTEDREALGDWAARVALAAQKDGVRNVVVTGSDAARAELASALGLLGIEVRAELAPRGWLRLPWRK